MYSVLISDEKRWKYYTNPNGSKYIAETLEAVQNEVKKIARTTALDNIVVVKNCTITETITVIEDGTEQDGE